MQTSIELPLRQQLTTLWDKTELFRQAEDWAAELGKDRVEWDYSSRSWVNGVVYPTYIHFEYTEDYVVFKLKFQSLLKF